MLKCSCQHTAFRRRSWLFHCELCELLLSTGRLLHMLHQCWCVFKLCSSFINHPQQSRHSRGSRPLASKKRHKLYLTSSLGFTNPVEALQTLVSFLAGGAYGLTSVAVGQPLDTVKTRMSWCPVVFANPGRRIKKSWHGEYKICMDIMSFYPLLVYLWYIYIYSTYI